jgi:DnaK suppressor protein
MLREKRRQIQAELQARSQELRAGGRPDTWDEADRSVFALDRELSSARLDQLGRLLRQVDQALARHAQGDYGRCQACGKEIPVKRLQSMPFALLCRECQEAQETPQGSTVSAVAPRSAARR